MKIKPVSKDNTTGMSSDTNSGASTTMPLTKGLVARLEQKRSPIPRPGQVEVTSVPVISRITDSRDTGLASFDTFTIQAKSAFDGIVVRIETSPEVIHSHLENAGLGHLTGRSRDASIARSNLEREVCSAHVGQFDVARGRIEKALKTGKLSTLAPQLPVSLERFTLKRDPKDLHHGQLVVDQIYDLDDSVLQNQAPVRLRKSNDQDEINVSFGPMHKGQNDISQRVELSVQVRNVAQSSLDDVLKQAGMTSQNEPAQVAGIITRSMHRVHIFDESGKHRYDAHIRIENIEDLKRGTHLTSSNVGVSYVGPEGNGDLHGEEMEALAACIADSLRVADKASSQT